MTTDRVKARFVVADYGRVVHLRNEPCPPWCHLCPHMSEGVMPYCYGSVCQNEDEFDLMRCTCDPNDPIVAHADLVNRTATLLVLLRDQRRQRRSDQQAAQRLVALSKLMRTSVSPVGQRGAWEEVERIGLKFIALHEAVIRQDAKREARS